MPQTHCAWLGRDGTHVSASRPGGAEGRHALGRSGVKRFELERAISENELVLHYQPIVEVPSRRLTGAEALVRWRHPERGLVSPLEFIPEAEATGLIRRLTFWVLREALLQANVWRQDGSALTVAVNLSVDNLHDTHFRRSTELTLNVAGGPELLIMEVPSRALARD